MIVPSMNDEDKVFEAVRAYEWLYGCYMDYKPAIDDKFRRGTRFPYIQRAVAEDDKKNKWHFVFLCLSKKSKRYMTMCYTTYEIPRKHKAEDVNAGKGCLLFDPISFKMMRDGILDRSVVVMDIVPHAVNRYTERYLKQKGLELDFDKKIENMLLRWQHFDVMADLIGDLSSQKHTEDFICPYDVFMRGGGMLRGQLVNSLLIRFFTYIGEDMMFDEQRDYQRENIGEYYRWKEDKLI